MSVLSLLVAAAWACEEPVDPHSLQVAAGEARAAFVQADREAFATAVAVQRAGAPCLREPASPVLVSDFHSTWGLVAFLERDEAGTLGAFQAALSADPDLEVESWLPEMHPLHLQVELARRLEAEGLQTLAPARGEVIWVDGAAAVPLVPSRPALLQLELEGAIVDGALYQPGSSLPAWAPPARERLAPHLRRRLALGLGTGAALVGAAAMTGLSAASYVRYTSLTTDYSELPELKRRANLSGAAAYGLGGAGLVLGTVLVITW